MASEDGNIINDTEFMQVKSNHFLAQKQAVLQLLTNTNQPLTSLEISFKTGILRANVCRHLAQLEKEDKIILAYKSLSPITKFYSGFYTAVREEDING